MLLPRMTSTYGGLAPGPMLAGPGPILDAYLDQMPVIRAQWMLDMAEAVRAGQANAEGYSAWRNRMLTIVNGERQSDSPIQSVGELRRRKLAELQERERAKAEGAAL